MSPGPDSRAVETGPEEFLNEIARGFVEAKILLTGCDLGVFDRVGTDGASAEEVARDVGGTLRGVEILLDALVAMKLLRKKDGVYRNRPELVPYLTASSPFHFPSLLRHRNRMFRTWAFLEERIRGDSPAASSERPLLTDSKANEDFIRAMFAVGHRNASRVAERVDLSGVRRMADLGGGPGHYLAAFAERSPEMEPYLVDLPLTLQVARKVLRGSPVFPRVHFVAWDLYGEEPPDLPGMDLAFLSQVVHAESPERNAALFRRIAGMLAPAGRLVVHENIVKPGRTEPADAALFAVNMLAMTPAGRTYTEEEIRGWGEAAHMEFLSGTRLDARSYLVEFRRS